MRSVTGKTRTHLRTPAGAPARRVAPRHPLTGTDAMLAALRNSSSLLTRVFWAFTVCALVTGVLSSDGAPNSSARLRSDGGARGEAVARRSHSTVPAGVGAADDIDASAVQVVRRNSGACRTPVSTSAIDDLTLADHVVAAPDIARTIRGFASLRERAPPAYLRRS